MQMFLFPFFHPNHGIVGGVSQEILYIMAGSNQPQSLLDTE